MRLKGASGLPSLAGLKGMALRYRTLLCLASGRAEKH